MSGKGAPELSVRNCGDLRVAVIAAQWHEKVMDGLVDGALRALRELGIDEPTLLRVPGSFELPVVAKVLAGRGYDAIVALGVVIRGGTPHFEYVSQGVTLGLTQVTVDTGVPVGFGVLTCDTEEQALDRAWPRRVQRGQGARSGHRRRGHRGHAAHRQRTLALSALRRPRILRTIMANKTFEELFTELQLKAAEGDPATSRTAELVGKGVHAIGKKVVEEAAEVWMAAEYEGKEAAAEEISQLLYHVQVMMVARGISLDDVYAHL